MGSGNSNEIKPRFKGSVHIGLNKYADVQMSDLTQASMDAFKLFDLCTMKENDFNSKEKITNFNFSYHLVFPKIIKTLDDFIAQSQGYAKLNPPQYTFYFISFSCHGVMYEDQTFAVIPFLNEETNAFEKQYVNINAYAKKLAQAKNTFNIILFDGCRNIIKKEDLGTMNERSKTNLLKAALEENQQSNYHGHTFVIYSAKKGELSPEDAKGGGRGTKTFLDKVEASIKTGNKSWKFIDSYGQSFIEIITESPRKEWKKIIMFTHYPIKVQPSKIQAQHEEEKFGPNAASVQYKEVKSGINEASMEPLDSNQVLQKNLNDQKQALLKQLEAAEGFVKKSELIDGFLDNLMSKTFDRHSYEVEAKSYAKSVRQKLETQQNLIVINEAFDWIFTHKAKQIYSKPQIRKTTEFNDTGDYNTTIIRANNGKVIQGGDDKKLYVLGSDLKLLKTIPVSGYLSSGMAIDNRLFCGQIDNKVTVFDEDTLALITTIYTQSAVRTMLLIQHNYLLIGQWKGQIDIIQISTLQNIFTHQLSQQADIRDVIQTSNLNEYVIALRNEGIVIVNIERRNDNNKFTLIENTTEYYFKDKDVSQLVEVQSQILIACVCGMKDLQVIDRKSKQVIATIPNASIDGYCNCLQKVIGYDDETFPYLLLKDEHKISVINVKKYTAVDIIEQYYQDFNHPYSMVQFQVNNELRLLTLYWNRDTKARSIKEFVIDSL